MSVDGSVGEDGMTAMRRATNGRYDARIDSECKEIAIRAYSNTIQPQQPGVIARDNQKMAEIRDYLGGKTYSYPLD